MCRGRAGDGFAYHELSRPFDRRRFGDQFSTRLRNKHRMPDSHRQTMRAKNQQRSRSARKSPTRILIVDDHPLIRERLTEAIEREPDLMVCGEAEDVQSGISAAENTKPHL